MSAFKRETTANLEITAGGCGPPAHTTHDTWSKSHEPGSITAAEIVICISI